MKNKDFNKLTKNKNFNLYYFLRRIGSCVNQKTSSQDIDFHVESILRDMSRYEKIWDKLISGNCKLYTLDKISKEKIITIIPLEKISHEDYSFLGIEENSTRKRKYYISKLTDNKEHIQTFIKFHKEFKELFDL